MLKHLHIKNFALAENVSIDFEAQLNIITGETGAGKSILVGAISAVLGSRVFTEVVRTGADRASVEAIFDIEGNSVLENFLVEKGLHNGPELYLRREINPKGNTRAFINDTAVSITTASQTGEMLVDLHGQNQHQSLLKKETHRYFVDEFGQLSGLLAKVRENFLSYQSARKKLISVRKNQAEIRERADLLKFQLNEIEQADLQIAEDEKLSGEKQILANAEKIFELTNHFKDIVIKDNGQNLIDLMHEAQRQLNALTSYSPNLKEIAEEFNSAIIIIEESARNVEEFQSSVEFNPVRLNEVEERLSQIDQLKKKYGQSISEILDYRDKIKDQLEQQENFEFEIGAILKDLEVKRDKYLNSAQLLSDARKKTAADIIEKVQMQLQIIGMQKTKFKIGFDIQEDPASSFIINDQPVFADEFGFDQLEFYISPNPGEDFKPLIKIASGGEISRIMLALKNILANVDQIPLLVFDEIDTGVSGQIALSVGKSIQMLSRSHQVICITHLPQIAAFADAHFQVSKYIDNGRTFTKIENLRRPQQIDEIASLMSGKELSDSSRQSARELIDEAQRLISHSKNQE